MKIILAMVMSADGKTTKWEESNINDWTSQEDSDHFFSLIEKNNAILMGRKTYSASQSVIKLSSQKLRIVITKDPNKYSKFSVPNQLEFTNDDPKEIVDKLIERGFDQALLVGGENVNALFFKSKLISEIWLTVEPKIFGSGNSLVKDEKLDIGLELMSINRLNKKGTLLLKYKIL